MERIVKKPGRFPFGYGLVGWHTWLIDHGTGTFTLGVYSPKMFTPQEGN